MPYSDHQEVRNYSHGSPHQQQQQQQQHAWATSSFSTREAFRDEVGGDDGDETAGVMMADPVLAPPFTSPTTRASRWCRRPGILCILLGLLMVGVAVAVGLAYSSVASSGKGGGSNVDAKSSAKNNEPGGADTVPTASPAPTTTMQPTPPNPCPDQFQGMEDCLGDRVASVMCQSCVSQYWPDQLEDCSDIDDETCIAFQECEICANCLPEVGTYVQCLSGCPLECPALAPTSSPAPTSTPAPTAMRCPDEYAAFDACVNNNTANGGDPCEECITTQYWPDPTPNCTEMMNSTCAGLASDSSCPCNGCDAETIAVLICLSDCDAWECDGNGAEIISNGTNRRLAFPGPRHWRRRSQTTMEASTWSSGPQRRFADYWNGAL